MPKISQKGLKMPESPIRKLVPYAEEAKKRGTRVLFPLFFFIIPSSLFSFLHVYLSSLPHLTLPSFLAPLCLLPPFLHLFPASLSLSFLTSPFSPSPNNCWNCSSLLGLGRELDPMLSLLNPLSCLLCFRCQIHHIYCSLSSSPIYSPTLLFSLPFRFVF